MRVPQMALANDARETARELVYAHHPHLITANILYVYTDQARKRCDRVRLGSAAKMTSLQRFFASGFDGVAQGPDFVILIDSNEWHVLTKAQRTALLDHELSHCALFVRDDSERPAVWLRWTPELNDPQDYAETRWDMRGHDIEEFAEVLARHGWWKPDSPEHRFAEVVALQLTMPETTARTPSLPDGNGTTAGGGSRSRKRAAPAD